VARLIITYGLELIGFVLELIGFVRGILEKNWLGLLFHFLAADGEYEVYVLEVYCVIFAGGFDLLSFGRNTFLISKTKFFISTFLGYCTKWYGIHPGTVPATAPVPERLGGG
jgi:hypothetical protein